MLSNFNYLSLLHMTSILISAACEQVPLGEWNMDHQDEGGRCYVLCGSCDETSAMTMMRNNVEHHKLTG